MAFHLLIEKNVGFFLEMHMRDIKAQLDMAFHRALWDATEEYNPDTKGPRNRSDAPYPPTFMATNDIFSKSSNLTFEHEDPINKEIESSLPSTTQHGTTAFMDRIERREIQKGNAN